MEITRSLKALVQLKAAQYNYFSEYAAVNDDDEYAAEQVRILEHEIKGIKECAEALMGSDCTIDYMWIENTEYNMMITKITIGTTVLYKR